MHCCYYLRLGKIATQVTTRYQSVRSAPFVKTEKQDASKPNDVIDDCNNTEVTATCMGISAECPITTPGAEITTPNLTEFGTERAQGTFCRKMAGTVGRHSLCYLYDHHGILVRTAPLDGAIQTVVPNSLLPRLLFLSHYPKLTGPPGERHMYDSMRRELY